MENNEIFSSAREKSRLICGWRPLNVETLKGEVTSLAQKEEKSLKYHLQKMVFRLANKKILRKEESNVAKLFQKYSLMSSLSHCGIFFIYQLCVF